MQLNLQLVDKVPFSTFASELLPRKSWKIAFLASKWVGASAKTYPELFPSSPGGQLRKESPSALFRSNWVKYDYKPRSDKKKRCFRSDQGLKSYLTIQLDRKSAGGDVLQLGPWRSGKQLWIHLGENSDSFWGEKDQFPTFSGQKLMQTYWTVLFQRTAKNISAQELAWY